MVGFNRRFAPLRHRAAGAVRRPAPGRLGVALPGQRRAARRGQLVPQRGARGLALRRRGRPLHRHAERARRRRPGRGARRAAPSGGRARDAALRRRVGRHDHLRHRAAAPRFPKETLDVAGGRRAAPGWTTSSGSTVWTAEGKAVKRALDGQDKGQRAQLARVRRGRPRPARPMPIPLDSLVATHPRHARGRRRAWRPAVRWRCEHCRRSAGTSGGCGGCRRPRWPAARRDHARRRLWARRQVRPGEPDAAGAAARADRRVRGRRCPAAPRGACRAEAAAARRRGRRPAADGRLGRASASTAAGQRATRTGSCDPVTGRRAPDRRYAFARQPPRRERRPATSSRSGSCRGTTT